MAKNKIKKVLVKDYASGEYVMMKEKRVDSLILSMENKSHNWLDEKLFAGVPEFRFRRQRIYKQRLFDFWCAQIGVAIEVHEDSIPSGYAVKDAKVYDESAIIIYRIVAFNEFSISRIIDDIKESKDWNARRRVNGLKPINSNKSKRSKKRENRRLLRMRRRSGSYIRVKTKNKKAYLVTRNGNLIPKTKYEKYQKYLKSSAWQKKRKEAFDFHGRKCANCGDTESELHIHHLTYDRLYNERLSDLIPLCKLCHAEEHQPKNRVRKALPSQLADAGTRSQYV